VTGKEIRINESAGNTMPKLRHAKSAALKQIPSCQIKIKMGLTMMDSMMMMMERKKRE